MSSEAGHRPKGMTRQRRVERRVDRMSSGPWLALYPGSRFRMTDKILETHMRQLIEAHAGAQMVELTWHRGEPTLMGPPFVRRAVELVDR